ncbi:MAG TPA: crotonase/enoyl-CoA hydratase family protein [Acidimicrobiales bacterium]|nr:crotonase/enoyl-CoA hydratase family protein [Acidimicrobiales bacterium]
MSDGDGAAVVTTMVEDGVAVVRFDDGKVNALSFDAIAGLDAALDTAAAEASAMVLIGGRKAFSAGFDLSVMSSGMSSALKLMGAGGDLMMRLFVHPQPVVAAATGHALAAGVLLLSACDVRFGADVPAKIGLNETAIGMSLPLFAMELARDRLTPRSLLQGTLLAELYDPQGAVAVGWLDRVVPAAELEAAAIAEARRLGQLPATAYATTKQLLRQPLVDRVKAGTAADTARFVLDPPA